MEEVSLMGIMKQYFNETIFSVLLILERLNRICICGLISTVGYG
jgi:hypothetical protein